MEQICLDIDSWVRYLREGMDRVTLKPSVHGGKDYGLDRNHH